MTMNFQGKSLGSKAMSVALGCALAVGGVLAQPAHAHPRSLVGFGDSIVANPSPLHYATPKAVNDSTNLPNCTKDPNGMVKQIATRLNLTPYDFSCPGASVITGGQLLSDQVNRAIASGALDAGTSVVTMTIGANDTYPRLLRGQKPADIQRDVVAAMVPELNRIKKAAPNAKVKVVGYPSYADKHGVCLVQLGNNVHSYEPIKELLVMEDLMEGITREAARGAGVQYVDVRAASYGHGMCAADKDRWYGAFVELGQPANIPIHMTNIGVTAVADIVARS